MLNDLENAIKDFFTQFGISVKSSNSRIDADQVARLLADQIFLHTISQGSAQVVVTEKPARKPRKTKETTAIKPKRKYQRKPKDASEIVEGTEGAV